MTLKEKPIISEEYRIRPAGRHILTIGKDLIKDNFAALIELVKNGYDADAEHVDVIFSTLSKTVKIDKKDQTVRELKIKVIDNGHGMDFETVINKWMVPSTDDKLKRKYSPGERLMQGRKGVGRYAVSILGDILFLETVSKNKEKTSVYIDWNIFDKHKYLEDVPILIEKYKTTDSNGTSIEIIGDENKLLEWTEKEIDKLKFELKKLISPFPRYLQGKQFSINLIFDNFYLEKYNNGFEEVKPYPIVDLFDYRISGRISKTGKVKVIFENNSIKGIPHEAIDYQIVLENNEEFCGLVNIDIRVFDRDTDSIQNLIDRGLKDPVSNKPIGKLQARKLLNEYNGIGVYRNGFRIRPHGDPGYDWLELDKERVQNPGLKIGSDQVIGFVFIEPEEVSHLEEKSARDGLKENIHYAGLQKIVKDILSKLESRRFQFRSSIGKGRKKQSVEEMIDNIFNFDDLKQSIEKELTHNKVKDESKKKVISLISQKEEANNRAAKIIRDTIAIYQGQATLGKIINVVLHEGRKPLSYFKNQIPILDEWAKKILKQYDESLLIKLNERTNSLTQQADILVKLFSRLDPFAAKSRPHRKEFNFNKVVKTVFEVFEGQLKDKNINFQYESTQNIKYTGWESDFYVALTNLLENSIYWFNHNIQSKKNIIVAVSEVNGTFRLDYYDNGVGIDEKLIESGVIFEPHFTTKVTGGTGLGLAIAGESMERNNCTLKALYVDEGVHFRIQPKQEINSD